MTDRASLDRGAFLFAVSQTGNLTIAAEFAGTSRAVITKMMTEDASFQAAVAQALAEAEERVFYQTMHRALVGTDFAKMKIADRKSLSQARHMRLRAAAKSQADWQAFMAHASAQSWKDEAWTLCFIVILAMCFIPAIQIYVAEGFALLEMTPPWFQWACLASIGAIQNRCLTKVIAHDCDAKNTSK